jgi:hypothetical protein
MVMLKTSSTVGTRPFQSSRGSSGLWQGVVVGLEAVRRVEAKSLNDALGRAEDFPLNEHHSLIIPQIATPTITKKKLIPQPSA